MKFLYLSTIFKSERLRRSFANFKVFVALYIVFSTYLFFRVPEAFDNFWAEDGSYFYNDFLNNPSIGFFFEFSLGYYLLVDRIFAVPITFVSPFAAPYFNALLTTLIMSMLAVRFFVDLSKILFSRVIALTFSVLFFVLPISSFESIGAATGLHFVLNFYVVFVLVKSIYGIRIDRVDVIILVISFLSGPLSLLLVPVATILSSRKIVRLEFSRSAILLLAIGILVQIFAVIVEFLSRSRDFGPNRSIAKVSYLFLERVLGYNLVPQLSYVNSATFTEQPFAFFVVRAAFLTVLLFLILVSFFLAWSRILLFDDKCAISTLALAAFLLWFIPGYLFNPEPRYAVAPALAVLISLFILFDRFLTRTRFGVIRRSYLIVGFFLIFGLTVFFNSAPSQLRIDGPSLRSQIDSQIDKCSNSDESISVLVRPERNKLWLKIPCERLTAS
jgi:hypothetical protein